MTRPYADYEDVLTMLVNTPEGEQKDCEVRFTYGVSGYGSNLEVDDVDVVSVDDYLTSEIMAHNPRLVDQISDVLEDRLAAEYCEFFSED